MTHELWASLNRHMVDYLDSVSLHDLVEQQKAKEKAKAGQPQPAPVVQEGRWAPATDKTTVG
jgi:Rrf2 family iron-sulfur cluster assembly transcriptional regulator